MPKVHLIGIGGAGLSGIATILLQQGYTITGSDMQATTTTQRLTQLGAQVFIGHRAENLSDTLDAVILSSAVPPHNPELSEARRRGLRVVKRAEWLGHMLENRVGIAIAGTHGKTTTTAMTAYLLQQAEHHPTFLVGGFVPQLNTSAAAGQGDAFVIEADEYDYTFLGLRPEIAVVTIVEWDHPDIFPSPVELKRAFESFVSLVPPHGLVIGCGDDPGVREVIRVTQAPTTTYGLQPGNDWQAVEVQPNQRGGHNFKVVRHVGQDAILPYATVSLAVPGLHNVCNALAALIVANQRGIDPAQAATILSQFEGVGRRFELKGEVNGISVIDDYAHHPTEIKATLAAARTRFPGRPIWAAFQPHTFSRTQALLDDFAAAFSDADHVVVVDIFASREVDEGTIHSSDMLQRMQHPDARYVGTLAAATDYLVNHLNPGAVLVTMGAGDSYKIGEWVLERLDPQRFQALEAAA